ncbi:MAG: carboxypeptidase-like regulatory domain-containing protein [Cyclobacteriaceae bacterium]
MSAQYRRIFLLLALVVAVSVVFTTEVSAQRRRVIQLSGMVLSKDTTSNRGIPGVNVYVPNAYGTPTNVYGFFSMPVQVGDSVVFSAVGFVRRHYIVPENAPEFTTIMIELSEDKTILPNVVVMPFPTEEVFKQAVLAMNGPLEKGPGISPKAMNAELMAMMARTAPMDASMNYRYYMDQYAGSVNQRFQPVVNPFLNPFNWARFFRDLKKNKKN